MATATEGHTRWILVPDQRFDASRLDVSGATQAGARPGTPEPTDAAAVAALQVSGSQDRVLEFAFSHGGVPARGTGARVLYGNSGENPTGLRGWIPPSTVTQFTCLSFSGAFTTNLEAFDAVGDPDSGQVMIAVLRSSPAGVHVGVIDPEDPAVFTAATAVTLPDGASAGAPSLCRLPTGRVLLVIGNGAILYSDNFGLSWSTWASGIAIDPDNVAWTQRRTVYHAPTGALVHVAWTNAGVSAASAQWVSYDLGHTWSEVTTGANSKSADWLSVAVSGAFIFGWILSATSGVIVARAGSGGSSVIGGGTTVGTFGSSLYINGAGWADEDGVLWFCGTVTGTARRELWRSVDDGATWEQALYELHQYGTTAASWASQVHVAVGGATWALDLFGGVTVRAHRLGGWSSATPPIDQKSKSPPVLDLDLGRVAWGGRYTAGGGAPDTAMWLNGYGSTSTPSPSNRGWTATGTATETDGRTGWKVVTTAGNARSYTPSSAWGSDTRVVVNAQLYVEAGGSVSSNDVAIRALASGKGALVRFSTTQIRVLDVAGGTALATVSYDTTTSFCVLVSVDVDKVTVLVRRPWETKWTEVCDAGSLTSSGSTTEVVWGHIAAAASTSHWQFVSAVGTSSSDYADLLYWSDSANSVNATPIGRAIGANPVALGDLTAAGETTFLSLVDGPAYRGESHVATPQYDYPATAVLWTTSPSPRTKWRSTDTSEQILSWPMGDATGPNAWSHIGLVVKGANFSQVYLEGWTGSAWEEVLAMSLVVQNNLTWRRANSGDVVVIAGGMYRYLWENELQGGTLKLGSKYRRIAQQHAGAGETGGAQPVLRLSDLDGTEGSSGTTGELWAPGGVHVVVNRRTRYSEWRIRIPAGSTADGYFEAGLIAVCSAHPLGQSWDWGWSWDHEAPAVRRTVQRDGSQRTRALGPTVRSLSVAWPNGVDQSKMRGWAGGDLPYVDIIYDSWSTTLVSGKTVAEYPVAVGDVPWLVSGLFETLEGGAVPCALLDSYLLDAAASSEGIQVAGSTVHDPTAWVWGYLQTSVSLEHQLGSDTEGEVYRVQTLTIREAT